MKTMEFLKNHWFTGFKDAKSTKLYALGCHRPKSDDLSTFHWRKGVLKRNFPSVLNINVSLIKKWSFCVSQQGRPFPDSDNIFLPAPTPPTQPQSPQSPRFPSRTRTTQVLNILVPSFASKFWTQASPVRSNGQFSFGELPVRRRRGHKQGSQTR